MKLTKQQTILAGVLGIAAIVLVADRLHSSSAQVAAEPADSAFEVAAMTNETPITNDAPSRAGSRMNVTDRLRRVQQTFAKDAELVDAFGTLAGAPGVSKSSEVFPEQIKLTGVMFSGKTRYAVIDGRSLRVGDYIGSYRLLSVGRQTAQLQSGNDLVTLTLTE